MKELQTFNNLQFGNIRTITNTDNNPMFVANDVATALGYSKPNNAISTHCKHATLRQGITDSTGRVQAMNIIPESDLYRLVLKSQLPDAEKFQDWVCEEVLPSIRKQGLYITDVSIDRMLSDPDTAIKLLQTIKDERSKRVLIESENKELQSKALFSDAVTASNRSCLIGELAKILSQNGVEIGQNRLFRWFRNNGYLCKKGDYYNQPTQKSMDLGLFEIKQSSINKPDGSTLITNTTKVTGKGQVYFVNKFLGSKSL